MSQPGIGGSVDPVGLEHRLTRMEERQESQLITAKDIQKLQRELVDSHRAMNGLAKDTASALMRHMDSEGHETLRERVVALEKAAEVHEVEQALVHRILGVVFESRLGPLVIGAIVGVVMASHG